MISTLKRIQAKKAAQENNGGFTLIELLIVIVVLGILAAVVVFSLGSVTSKSAVSACQADGATVNTAMSAYNANNGSYPTSQAQLTGTANGGPYLQSWPNNTSHYQFALDSSGNLWVALPSVTTATGGTGWVKWTGAQVCTTTAVTGSNAQPATVA
jgi:general secretion pathway protein G